MLLPLKDRNIAYDLIGSDSAPAVCMTHSLASDSGMWAEQVPALLSAGYRVLRIDMRGHGGSDPVEGDYTMSQLAADVSAVLDSLSIPKVHFIGLSIGGMLGQAFAIKHGNRLLSAMWCDTLPASPVGAAEVWQERMKIVRDAGSLAPLADVTVERWLTTAVKARNPGRWKQIRDTVIGTSAAGYLGCSAAIQSFDFVPKLPRRWKFIDDSGVEPSYVKLEYQVLGLVMQISGTANRLSLTDPTTGQDERVQINATFAGKTRTYPVTQYLTEAELREASKAVSSEILKITHGRNRLPRIQTDKIYWPPSDRAMRFISESIHTQVRQGTFEWSSIHGLTFEQVEGTDLSRISDPIAHDHQAAYDPTWSPTRHRKPSLKPRTH